MAKAPECCDCIQLGIETWRPVKGKRKKRCVTHTRAKAKADYERNRDKARERNFGLTPERHKKLLQVQGGLCALCGPETGRNGSTKALATDHDHRCCPGRKSCGNCVRGALCSDCNRMLGRVNDSIEFARRLLDYLIDPPYQKILRGEL